MGCAGCSTKSKDGTPVGCRSNGNCGTGGCNKLNTYDWLSTQEIRDVDNFNLIEVSFKNGARKGFYINQDFTNTITGDMVVVEASTGLDVGRISLSGELVRLQMKKKNVHIDSVMHRVVRRANQRDLEKLDEARSIELDVMVRARAITRTLDIDMKVGDVEFQGDKRKATFYYTADGRIDFRELIRHFAKEFKVKIEMRQIGARQESARLGGLGSCGRELCCSTWLSDFKSVSTAAARYQNLAINQAKLSGQCGRLKCCLNYELDTYLDAIEKFPKNVEKLKTKAGTATLVKTDIFKGVMFYAYHQEGGRLGKFHPLELKRVREIKAMNAAGEFPLDLIDFQAFIDEGPAELDFESVNEVIELPMEERRKKRRGGNRNRGGRNDRRGGGKNDRRNAGGNNRSGSKPAAKKGGISEKPAAKKANTSRKSTPKKADTGGKKQIQSPKKGGGKPNFKGKKSGNKPSTNPNPKGGGNAKNKGRNTNSRNRGGKK